MKDEWCVKWGDLKFWTFLSRVFAFLDPWKNSIFFIFLAFCVLGWKIKFSYWFCLDGKRKFYWKLQIETLSTSKMVKESFLKPHKCSLLRQKLINSRHFAFTVPIFFHKNIYILVDNNFFLLKNENEKIQSLSHRLSFMSLSVYKCKTYIYKKATIIINETLIIRKTSQQLLMDLRHFKKRNNLEWKIEIKFFESMQHLPTNSLRYSPNYSEHF